jgi:hypothetical protein
MPEITESLSSARASTGIKDNEKITNAIIPLTATLLKYFIKKPPGYLS